MGKIVDVVHVPPRRCFTFGIGSGASTALVEGLASAGNGTAEFVKEEERLQPKVRAVNNCYLVERESIVTNTGLLSHNSKHAAQRRVPQGLAIAIFSISAYRRTNLIRIHQFL